MKLAVLSLLVAAAIGASSGSARPVAASPTASDATPCIATGARWRRGSASGTRYVITRRGGVTCAFAKTWVARLSGRSVSRPAQRLTGAPRGYVCIATLPLNGKAAIGACGRGSSGAGFGWAPAFS